MAMAFISTEQIELPSISSVAFYALISVSTYLDHPCQIPTDPRTLKLPAFLLLKTFYNLYLHPLRAYPGPFLSRATRLHYVFHQLKGDLPYRTKELHDYYGEVVRIAPDELSYNTSQAYQEALGKTSNQCDEITTVIIDNVSYSLEIKGA
jgi:hypothetical protein